MRCPKCDYISFDQEETCKNCSRPLPISEELTGTAMKVGSYLFLSSVLGGRREESKAGELDADLGEMFRDDIELEAETVEGQSDSEAEVPTVDISQFDDSGEEEVEEELEIDGDDDGIEFSLDDDSDRGGVDGESETPLPEPEVKLDIDVDFDDEPEDGGIVFNLEDIDESDLIIDEEEGENGLDAETSEPEDDSIPMELAMEDGELIKGDKDKEKLEGAIELPDIDL